jgi:hypothetical protein
MQVNTVQPCDIEDYYDGTPLSELSDYSFFEALCEKIVEKNPSYKMECLSQNWENSDMEREEFAEEKFEKVIGDELRRYVTLEAKDKWVQSTCTGVVEFANMSD